MGRGPCCEKVGVKRGRWTREEDGLLARYIEEHGAGAWRSLPKNAGLLRCGKSCRLRWINYLRTDLKRGNISAEEEEMIIKLHATLGNRWSLIAGHLPGRTDNEIKNHWNSHLSRRARDDGVVVDVDLSKLPGGGKRRGGRTSSRGNAAAATKPAATKGKGKGKKKAAAGRAKAKPAAAAAAAETEHHHHSRRKEEDDSKKTSHGGGISTSSGCHPSTADASLQVEEQANHACSSGVTSDGHEEGALGLCEEMVSGLKGQPSPTLDVTPDASIDVGDTEPELPTAVVDHDELLGGKANMDLDHHHEYCNESEGGPAELAGQEEELDDKAAMEPGLPGYCDGDASGPLAQTVLADDKVMEWDLVGLDDHLTNDDLWSSMVWDYDQVVVAPGVGHKEESVLSDLFFLDNI